jgi:RecB family endonuclease NucS
MKHLPNMLERSFLYSTGDDRFRNWNPTRDGHWCLVNGEMQQTSGEADDDPAVDEGDLPVVERPISLSIERDLEDCLARNIGLVEPGLRLYTLDGGTGRQFNTQVVGIIDLLATDKQGGFVVIELKAGEAGDKSCGQLLRYLGWVEVNLARGKPVKGILVASDFSEGCRYAIKAAPSIQLKKYEVQFKFTEVPPVGV